MTTLPGEASWGTRLPHGQGSVLQQRSSETFDALLRSYGTRPEPLDVSFRRLVGPLPANDLTHSIFPYPGRLLRQIPRFFLHCEQLLPSGGIVLDPFCGSGTVLVEALVAGRASWGIDSNPFARLLTRVKTTYLDETVATQAVLDVLAFAKRCRSAPEPDVVNIDHWFTYQVKGALARLLRAINSQSFTNQLRDFLLVVLAAAAERQSVRDPRIPVPVRRRDWKRWSDSQRAADVWHAFEQSGRTFASRVSRLPRQPDWPSALVSGEDATAVDDIVTSGRLPAPALILTSPPYGAAQKYIRSSSLAIGWAGLASSRDLPSLERRLIGREHLRTDERDDFDVPLPSIAEDLERVLEGDRVRAAIYAHYFRGMDEALRELVKVLAPGGHLVLVAGSNVVAGQAVDTHIHLRDLAIRHGLTQIAAVRDVIRGRVLITRRANATVPLSSETVHVFRKPGAHDRPS